MRNRLSLVLSNSLVALFLSLFALAAHAEYPDRPIRMVVPWPAGGGTDVVVRAFSIALGEQLRQSVVVDNRPGAIGGIGSSFVAKSAPDGYTLVIASADTHAMNPHVFSKLTYDPAKDFAPVGILGAFPYALIVNSSFPADDVAEFARQAKQRPGQITFASWGVGSSAHVGMEMFRSQAGFTMLHVPYTGAAPALQAVAAGQVHSMIVPMSVAKPQADGGKVKILGLASPKRFPGAPNLKTFAEQGIVVDAGTWLGVMAPAGTPAPVVARLNRAIIDTLKDKKFQDQLIAMNVEPGEPLTAEQFKAFVDDEYVRWGKTIRGANIRAD